MLTYRKLSETEAPLFEDWIQDPETIKYSLSLFQKLKTPAQRSQWFEEVLNDDVNFNLGIFWNDVCVGYAGLTSISKSNASAEYFIFIGDKNSWGKGIGTATTQEITRRGFEDYKLNRIMLTVSEPNTAAVKAYTKSGFTTEGVLRSSCFRDGQYHNKIVMSVLKSEYNKA